MREIIRDPGDSNRRPSVVESDGLAGRVILEIDGQLHRLGPDEARRIARAMLQAASEVENAARGADGGGPPPTTT